CSTWNTSAQDCIRLLASAWNCDELESVSIFVHARRFALCNSPISSANAASSRRNEIARKTVRCETFAIDLMEAILYPPDQPIASPAESWSISLNESRPGRRQPEGWCRQNNHHDQSGYCPRQTGPAGPRYRYGSAGEPHERHRLQEQ